MLAIGFTLEADYHRVINHPIQQRHHQRWITQVICPVAEVDVRHERGRAAATAGIDDFVKQARRLGVFAPLKLVEPEFIDDQQVERTIVADPRWQRLVARRGGQVFQQRRTGHVTNPMPKNATRPPDPLNQVRFAQSTLTHQRNIVAAGYELAAGQFFNRTTRDRFGIERPVEGFQARRTGELGQTLPTLDRTFPREDRRRREEPFQQLPGGVIVLGRFANDAV